MESNERGVVVFPVSKFWEMVGSIESYGPLYQAIIIGSTIYRLGADQKFREVDEILETAPEHLEDWVVEAVLKATFAQRDNLRGRTHFLEKFESKIETIALEELE